MYAQNNGMQQHNAVVAKQATFTLGTLTTVVLASVFVAINVTLIVKLL